MARRADHREVVSEQRPSRWTTETSARAHKRGDVPRPAGWTGHVQDAGLRSDAPTVVMAHAAQVDAAPGVDGRQVSTDVLRSDAPTEVFVRPAPVDAAPAIDGWQVSRTEMPGPPRVA